MFQPPTASDSPVSRRDFIASLTVAGLGLQLGRSAVAADSSAMRRIDVHSHIAPPDFVRKLTPEGIIQPQITNWSVPRYLEDMDKAGVATAMTSITSPGLWFRDPAIARPLARSCNDYAAKLRADHPGRFGVFACLPLPDIEGSLREIEYGLDTLKADGIFLFTSYDNKWLGDPAFDPIFAELNRRRTLVYTHPVAANCCRNLVPGLSDASIEFGTDTTRAIAKYVFSGSAARYPDVRIIFSHAGGTMPFLMERFDLWSKTPPAPKDVPLGFRAHARKFYYDIAQSSNSVTMTALKSVVPTNHILFGTDWPFRTALEHVEALHANGVFTPAEIRGIERENFLALRAELRA
jgi:predicted TIM-barrel fold metal-dependent hydrolase